MKWYQMEWAQKYWGKKAKERYRRYLKSDTWKAKRKSVLQTAGFRCSRCNARATEVHHETYKRIYNERRSDLTALCRTCHQAVHTRPPKSRKRGTATEKRKSQENRQRKFYPKPRAGAKTRFKRR